MSRISNVTPVTVVFTTVEGASEESTPSGTTKLGLSWSWKGTPFQKACEWAKLVAAGEAKDCFGRPWPKTQVRIEF